MTQIKLKRVYDDWEKTDGYRVLVDKLWPRGIKKEDLHYDLWAKDIAPSSDLRKWFHIDTDNRWKDFSSMYKKELKESDAVKPFVDELKKHKVATLIYAAKDPAHNHAIILKSFLDNILK